MRSILRAPRLGELHKNWHDLVGANTLVYSQAISPMRSIHCAPRLGELHKNWHDLVGVNTLVYSQAIYPMRSIHRAWVTPLHEKWHDPECNDLDLG